MQGALKAVELPLKPPSSIPAGEPIGRRTEPRYRASRDIRPKRAKEQQFNLAGKNITFNLADECLLTITRA